MRKKILWISIFSMLVGLIHVFPHVLFQRELGKNYQDILLLGSPDEENYLIQIKEVYEGNLNIDNGVLAEHKTQGGLWQRWVPQIITGKLGIILGLSLPNLVMAMDFFLPAVTFLLFYFLLLQLSRVWQLSMISAAIAMLSPYIFLGYSSLLEQLSILIKPYYIDFLPFARPINPQLTIIPLLLFLFAFLALSQSPDFKKAVLAGILLGANLYLYFFWFYLYPFLGFSLFLSFLLKEERITKNALLVVFVSLLLALPILPLTFQRFFGPGSLLKDSLVTTSTHLPIVTFLQILELVVLVFLMFAFLQGKIQKIKFIFLISLLLAGVFVMNQQVITGAIVQPHHFELFLTPMIFSVVLFTTVWETRGWITNSIDKFLREKLPWQKIGRVVLGLWLVFTISEGFVEQYRSYLKVKLTYAYFQSLMGPIEWLNENSEPQSVVLAHIYDLTADQLAIYTNNNLYVSHHARHYPVPSLYELRDRLMNYSLITVISPDQFAGLISDQGILHYLFFGFRYLNLKPTDNYFTYNRAPMLSQAEFTEVIQKYEEKSKKDLKSEVKKYRLDYILYGPVKNPKFLLNPTIVPYLKMVYSDGEYIVFEVLDFPKQ